MLQLDQVKQSGYAFLSEYQPHKSSEVALGQFGPLLKLGTGPAVHRLRPMRTDGAPLNTYSGQYGLNSFPFHTDFAHWRLPPRYLALRCVRGSKVPTLLLDGGVAVESDSRKLLIRSKMRPRRPVKGSMPLLRLFEPREDHWGLLRWDASFIVPTDHTAEEGAEYLSRWVLGQTAKVFRLMNPGDTLIVDNWRMLHARGDVGEDDLDRAIDRAYTQDIYG